MNVRWRLRFKARDTFLDSASPIFHIVSRISFLSFAFLGSLHGSMARERHRWQEAKVRAKVKEAKTETAPKVKAKGKPRGQGVKAKAVGNGRNEDLPLLAKRISHLAVPTSQENVIKELVVTTGTLQFALTGRRANALKIVALSFTAKNQATRLLVLHLLQQTPRLKVKLRQSPSLIRKPKVLWPITWLRRI